MKKLRWNKNGTSVLALVTVCCPVFLATVTDQNIPENSYYSVKWRLCLKIIIKLFFLFFFSFLKGGPGIVWGLQK